MEKFKEKLSDEAAGFLARCKLTGNVRQLENICYWFTVMVAGQTIDVKDMPSELLEENGAGHEAVLPCGKSSLSYDAPHGGEIHEPSVAMESGSPENSWEKYLEQAVAVMLERGEGDLMDVLGARFERVLIRVALMRTRGRKNDAAVLLGIGRNTIARKIHELGMEESDSDNS